MQNMYVNLRAAQRKKLVHFWGHFLNVHSLKDWVTVSSVSKNTFPLCWLVSKRTFPTKQDSFQRNLMPLDSLTSVKLPHAVEKQNCVVSVPDLLLLINAYWVSILTFHLLIIIQLILTFWLAANWTGQPAHGRLQLFILNALQEAIAGRALHQCEVPPWFSSNPLHTLQQ